MNINDLRDALNRDDKTKVIKVIQSIFNTLELRDKEIGELKRNKWINVDEDLPQADFEVIVCVDDDVFTDTFRSGFVDGEYWFDSEVEKGYTITHWQSLPPPY